ncbi:MBL fold metallo-hydrolase [Geoglobus acetivorans]|uniref:Ribonuclease Z n=1 Tax=Geoglobus acetivorans TaxID=565033 RepID=A0A0A7GDV0_GEOAI|nr:Ribonuclease Z [Geoglobus acetivorans]
MKITFLGTGVAVSLAEKAQQSILIEDDRLVLVDCGFGTMLRLQQAGYDVTDLDAVVLTHFHLDHCGELMGILKARWLSGAGKLKIYAPKGAESFHNSFLSASPYLLGKLDFGVLELEDGERFMIGSMRFEARKTRHSLESLGYVINGVLISGDTSAFPELYEDVEVTVHEMSLDFGGRADYHTSPENLAENAESVREAYLIHLYPPAYGNREKIAEFLRKKGVAAEFPDDLEVLSL